MEEQITPRQLLENITKSLFENEPTDTLQQAPLDELMEQILALGNSEYPLGWLFSQFWADSRELTPQQGTPMVDNHGQLWSREDMGNDLTDDEYALVVHIYELARWSHSIYYRLPFDLRLLLPDFEPTTFEADFQYTNEALHQWAVQTPHRRLAALITHRLVSSEADKSTTWNQTIQDYYAEHSLNTTVNWSHVTDCEAFTKSAWEDMQVMGEHCAKARALGLTQEQQRVADALWSWVPHDFDDDVVLAAREICEQAQQLMPDALTIRSEQGSRAYIIKVHPEIVRIANAHDVYLDTDDGYSLTMGYLNYWLDDKYWGERRAQYE